MPVLLSFSSSSHNLVLGILFFFTFLFTVWWYCWQAKCCICMYSLSLIV